MHISARSEISQAEEEELERGKELVAHAQQLLATSGFKVHALVEKGDPRAVIVDHAARWNADLIVLGSHGLKGLDRLLIAFPKQYFAMRPAQLRSCVSRLLA